MEPKHPLDAYVEECEKRHIEFEKNHPIKYFFIRTVPLKLLIIRRKFRDFIWWFRYRLQPKHRYHVDPYAVAIGTYYGLEEARAAEQVYRQIGSQIENGIIDLEPKVNEY